MLTVVLALCSALVFGTGVALQQQVAAAASESLVGRPALLVLLSRQPLWLVGLFFDIGGFALQAAALSRGSLVVVQPLIATSLLVTLLLIAATTRSGVTAKEWAATGLVLVGLVVLLTVGTPQEQSGSALGPWRWAVCMFLFVAAAGACLIGALRTRGTRRAVLLALAAGIADAFMAVLTKAFADSFGHGFVHLVVSWTPYALAAGGVAAMMLTQSAYQAGRPTVTLPIITVAEPLLSSVVGITLFSEQIAVGFVRTPVVLVGVLAMVAGLISLGRGSRVVGAEVDLRSIHSGSGSDRPTGSAGSTAPAGSAGSTHTDGKALSSSGAD